ncbi:16791_t:CDS:1, partial [Gigaspora rosea]
SVYPGEVYVDPVTGFVTTLDPPILSSQPVTKSTQNQGSQKPISTSGNSQGSLVLKKLIIVMKFL